MRRTREQQAVAMSKAEVGKVDTMSALAAKVGLPLCGAPHVRTPHACTRAAGHAEGDGRPHPANDHVAADERHITKKVWTRR